MPAKTTKANRVRLAQLRAQRRAVPPWGFPWCRGSGDYHQGPVCEGCGGRMYIEEEQALIDAEIAALLNPTPAPVLSGEVFARDGDQYVLI